MNSLTSGTEKRRKQSLIGSVPVDKLVKGVAFIPQHVYNYSIQATKHS